LADAWHLKHLIDRAHALGADRAAPLPAASVVVDERVRLKCQVPRCSSYGRNLMCPPHVPGPAETRAALARYADVLLVQQDIGVTQAEVDEALDGRTYADSRARDGGAGATGDASGSSAGNAALVGCDGEIVAAQNAFAQLMTSLEAEAFKLGYRFAAAFAGGECVLCPVCAGVDDGVCRHPFEARPSMEAVGIDVIATARAAGLEIEMPAVERPSWTGMLLID
jgi:predicted metal-binding protein